MSRRSGFERAEHLMRSIRTLVASTEGGTAIEYALVLALVTMVIIGGIGQLAGALTDLPLPALIDAFASALS